MIKASEKRTSPPTKMARSIQGVVSDVFTLGELQIQLFKTDLRDGRTHLVQGIILTAFSVTLLLASLPVTLIAGGYGLVEVFAMPMWAAFLVSSAIGFVVGTGLLYAGSKWLSKSLGFFQRSSEELSNNVHWVKNMTSPARNHSISARNKFDNPR